MKFGADGRLYAINPEYGFFGVAPGTSRESNLNAMESIKKNAIFTNVAMTPEGDVWWEGMTREQPPLLKNWLRRDWSPGCGEDAAHPNSRFTVPASQCPVLDSNWESPSGVPISGIIFGGRRSSVVPLVYETFDWDHGTFVGSVVTSETTAAAAGKRGVLRPDPFAMKPFLGYHVGDYFQHWLKIGSKTTPDKLPKIFHVNWFRKSPTGKFLWPGFGENSRVLAWMFDRVNNQTTGVRTPIGIVPDLNSLDISGLSVEPSDLKELFKVEPDEWLSEILKYREFYASLGNKLPDGIKNQIDSLQVRLEKSKRGEKY